MPAIEPQIKLMLVYGTTVVSVLAYLNYLAYNYFACGGFYSGWQT